ncbi:MAG: glycosyltransferase family 2 protein [bacterium]
MVLIARNEERAIGYAIRSVRSWCDEVVVVDQESSDATAAIASALGARVISHPVTGYVEPARAFAAAQARGDWVLMLDADELVPPPLARALTGLATRDDVDAVRISRRNHLLGVRVAHSGWNEARDRCLRFFRRGAVTFPSTIHRHPQPVPGARVHELASEGDAVLLHFHHRDLSELVESIDRYTTIEARERVARRERGSALAAVWFAAREWAVRYLWHAGWRDGWRGFYLAGVMAFDRWLVHAKVAALAHDGDRDAAEARDRAEAERWLAGYPPSDVAPRMPGERPG